MIRNLLLIVVGAILVFSVGRIQQLEGRNLDLSKQVEALKDGCR